MRTLAGLRSSDIGLMRATPPGPEGTPSGLRSEPDPEGTPSASGFSFAPNLAVKAVACMLGLAAVAVCGQPVEIRVDAASTLGPYKSIYAYFGYDERSEEHTSELQSL